jgi:raffinose/stachyose/melibiose transport system substrate-binding protein
VKFEEKSFEQIRQNANMILNSDEAPDLMEYNKGNASAGLLSSQGLLTDLTAEVEKRGWDKKIGPSLQTTARYKDGIMGDGSWYGVPNYGEFVMAYYNQKLFEQHGVKVPTTFAELESAMDTFAKKGVTPLANGGAEYPTQQIFYQLALSKADRDWVNAFQLYQGEVDFHDAAFTYGAEKLADWVGKGYLDKDSASVKAEDMGTAFISGKFPIMLSGSWWYGRLAAEITTFEWGSFLFPETKLHLGSSGNIWVVPERGKAKELAYDFIDVTMRPEIQALLGNSGGLPVAARASDITDAKSRELVENFQKILDSDGLAFYPDWPAPGYYDVLVANGQELVNGTKDAKAFLDGIAEPYQSNRQSIGR